MQLLSAICVPIAVREGIEGKLTVEAHRNGEPPPPRLSTKQLVDVLHSIRNKRHWTVHRILDWVRENGIVAASDSDYDARNRRPRPVLL